MIIRTWPLFSVSHFLIYSFPSIFVFFPLLSSGLRSVHVFSNSQTPWISRKPLNAPPLCPFQFVSTWWETKRSRLLHVCFVTETRASWPFLFIAVSLIPLKQNSSRSRWFSETVTSFLFYCLVQVCKTHNKHITPCWAYPIQSGTSTQESGWC